MPDNLNPPTTTDKSMLKNGGAGFQPLRFDAEKYSHYLDELDLTEQQKQELLRTLWWIIVQLIDWGFNIHPIQCANKHDAPKLDIADLLKALIEPDGGGGEKCKLN